MAIKLLQLILSMLVTITLLSCGGGGGTTVAEGGIGGSGISTGTVTGFGSIYVNGVKYDTANTSFTSNGVVKNDQTHLRKGMVVTVRGDINNDGINGVANTVNYQLLIDAKITILTISSFMVLKQTVYHDSSLNLTNGSRYEISGYYDDAGNIHATFIRLSNSTVSDPFEIRGKITSEDISGTGTFNIGNLIITPDFGVSFGSVKINDFIEAKGTYDNINTLTAISNIEIEDSGFGINNLDDAELEGYILTSCILPLPCDINLNGQTVQINSATSFNASSAVDVQAGAEVEIEGSLVNGILIANEVEFKNEVEIEVEILSSNVGLDILGKKTLIPTDLPGLEIIISNDGGTVFDTGTYDDPTSANSITHFTFQGQMIAGKLIASSVGEGSSPNIKLHASVDSYVANTSITIAGQTILTAGLNIKLDDNSIAGKVISEVELYDHLSKNSAIVEFNGELTGGSIIWSDIELDL